MSTAWQVPQLTSHRVLQQFLHVNGHDYLESLDSEGAEPRDSRPVVQRDGPDAALPRGARPYRRAIARLTPASSTNFTRRRSRAVVRPQ
jgi:hypothetical protein